MKWFLFLSSVMLLVISVAAKLPAQTFPQPLVIAPSGSVPDSRLTPGAWTGQPVCTKGATREERGLSRQQAVRRAIFASYGVPWEQRSSYELDHLVPLCLGGLDDEKNLWPQPRYGTWDAHDKDRLEACACRLACEGRIDAGKASTEIARDWRTAYARIVPQCRSPKLRKGRGAL